MTGYPKDIAFARRRLDQRYPGVGRLKEKLVFGIDLYIDDAYSKDERAKIIAKVVMEMELQKVLPVDENQSSDFSAVITEDDWKKIEVFLESRGRSLGKDLL